MARARQAAAAIAVVVSVATCAKEASAPTGAPSPSAFVLISGDHQTGSVGQPLPAPLMVRVTTASGAGLQGAVVTFTVLAGGGALSSRSITTDLHGLASVSWTLGTSVGNENDTATASVIGLSGVLVKFIASATAGPPAQLASVSGNNQSGSVWHQLPQPLVVVVRDQYANPAVDVPVLWVIASTGGGDLSAFADTTDANGQASVLWTLGSGFGARRDTVKAVVWPNSLMALTETFVASAGPDSAKEIRYAGGGGRDTVGRTLPVPLVARVTDLFGNPVAGVAVTWTVTAGGGSIAPTSSVTDDSGKASTTLTLGTTAGVYQAYSGLYSLNDTVLAAASGLAGSPVTFVASAAPGHVTQVEFLTQPPPAVKGNVVISPAIQATSRDTFGNVVPTAVAVLTIGTNAWAGVNAGRLLGATCDANSRCPGNTVNGVTTFNVGIDKPGSGYALRATNEWPPPGTVSAASAPFDVSVTFSSVDVGFQHSCGVAIEGTYCWGRNAAGALGGFFGLSPSDSVPNLVFTVDTATFVDVSVGQWFTCAVRTGGTVYCWGNDLNGELGNGSLSSRFRPTPISAPAGVTFVSVSAGDADACAVTTSHSLYCWGDNTFGELGIGTIPLPSCFIGTCSNVPLVVSAPAGVEFSSTSGANGHTCAVTTTGVLYCWGYNCCGQLGIGSQDNNAHTAPIVVLAPHGVTFASVSAGGYHTCAVANDGTVYCWGANNQGQLGDGTTSDALTPTAVVAPAGVAFSSVSAGGAHTCAVTTPDGSVYCWGDNTNGQLGNGTTTGATTPVWISDGFTSVSASQVHTCGRRTLGLFCWGKNEYGQLGDGSTIPRLQPVRVVQ